MSNDKQKWINLSNKNFEDKKYENGEGVMCYFKPTTGLWFSLPSDDEYMSEWGNYIKDEEDLKRFMDENGRTNIITAELRDSVYTVKLEDWKQEILEVLNNTSYDTSNEEKRNLLLSKIKQKQGDNKIEYLIFDIEENEFADIERMYYEQSGDKIKKQKNAKEFSITEETFGLRIGSLRGFDDFKDVKKKILLKIKLLKKIYEGDKNKKLNFEELENYFDKADNDVISNCEDDGIEDKDEILYKIIEREKNLFGYLTVEMLDEYEEFISNVDNKEEYKITRREKVSAKVERNKEIEWLTDYFSGCINKKSIRGYDMPSLCIFDTNCIKVLSQRKEILFWDRENTQTIRPTNKEFEVAVGEEMLLRGFNNNIANQLIDDKMENKDKNADDNR